MRTEGNLSKVAICPKCEAYTLACHVDYLTKITENEFEELANEGFVVQLETIEKTRSRNYRAYSECPKSMF